MNSPLFDLNLLRVFLTIWELRSLTAAGERLGITQPAMSHALKRLRNALDDQLFVRDGQSMLPTETAVLLHAPLAEALNLISNATLSVRAFNPLASKRVFNLAMSDVGEAIFLPPLIAALTVHAPGVVIRVSRLDSRTLAGQLRSGALDLAIGFMPNVGEGVICQPLIDETFVCMVRQGHPIAHTPMSREVFTSLGFIYADWEATGHQYAEQWLERAGISRKRAITVAHFIVAPQLLLRSNLAVVFPKILANRLNNLQDFALLPVPHPIPSITIAQHTHQNFSADPALSWLKKIIERLTL